MTPINLPSIVDVIGDHYAPYCEALAEAEELARREELETEEMERFTELVGKLEKDRRSLNFLLLRRKWN